jgi:hypothetical protein
MLHFSKQELHNLIHRLCEGVSTTEEEYNKVMKEFESALADAAFNSQPISKKKAVSSTK